jgi:hypothetical protein
VWARLFVSWFQHLVSFADVAIVNLTQGYGLVLKKHPIFALQFIISYGLSHLNKEHKRAKIFIIHELMLCRQ